MKPSNLYVERIYKDHPIACWALDDEVSFKQLLDVEDQDLSTWDTTDATVTRSSFFSPVNNAVTNLVTLEGGPNFTAEILSPFTVISSDNTEFAVHVNHQTYLCYRYDVGTVIDAVETFTSYEFNYDYGWKHLSHSFLATDPATLFIRVHVYGSGPFLLQLAGASVGKDAEPYSPITMGYTPVDDTMPLDAYSVDPDNNGYYVDGMVRQGGIPMAFGSYQTLIVNPVALEAAFYVPGSGFLNQSGIGNSYTLEFWIRASEPDSEYRIVGPADSSDGIYISNGHITIQVAQFRKSYFVGKWNRPMLVHFQYSPRKMSLMVNGTPVISIDIDEVFEFAPTTDEIVFYAIDKEYEIDSIALYPYLVPPQMAKKHFVYGQGVQEYDFSNDKFLKRTMQIDYPVAGYSFNVMYPDTIKWRSGFTSGLDASSSFIRTREYALPQFIVSGGTKREWLDAIYSSGWTMNPDDAFEYSSIYFKTMNVIGERINAILGRFKSPASSSAGQSIMLFTNKRTGERIAIDLDGNDVEYKYIDPSGTPQELQVFTVLDDAWFSVGFNPLVLASESYGIVGNFFSSQDNISLTVGGSDAADQFLGEIENFGFYSQYDYAKSGLPADQIYSTAQAMTTETLTYCLGLQDASTSYNFDISTRGYWEDVIPLTMFDRRINTGVLDIDFIQFNIDAPGTFGISKYVTLQPIASAGEADYSDFVNIEPVPSANVVDLASSTDTKYEVVDDTILVIPRDIDYTQYALGLHLEFSALASLSAPLVVKRLELASFASNDGETKIGTKYSVPLYQLVEV